MKVLVLLFLAALVFLCSCQRAQVATNMQNENDLKTLNYALTLEHLEATFYTEGLARFNATDFEDAGFSPSVRAYVNLIRAHENSHVQLLTTVIESQGATAVRQCQYDFTSAFSSVQNFLATARLLETTGTMAYDGAANTINNAVYLQVAATIATVEARHSAFLNELNQESPFPTNFEMTLTPEQVIQAASGFFVSCPDSINNNLPVFAFELVPLSTNFTYYNRSGQEETSEQIDNDNDVLNYALTLELFGHAFLSAANFTQQDFSQAGYGDLYAPYQMIIAHENAHLEFLQQTLESRGAKLAQPCTYNFGSALNSVGNFLEFSRMLENLEVTAYDGVINDLTDYQLIQGAATIATVEARHAQFLNNALLGISVNNESLDMARAPELILNLTAPFFGADCQRPIVPVEAYTLQAYGTTVYPGTATPSTCPGTPSMSASPSSCPGTPSMSASPSSCPGMSASASPSCSGSGASSDDDDNVTINFYFADMLRGL